MTSSWRPVRGAQVKATCIRPITDAQGDELPINLGEEAYIREQGGVNGEWLRVTLVAHPSILSASTGERQGLEERCYNGIVPRNHVRITDVTTDDDNEEDSELHDVHRTSVSFTEKQAQKQKERQEYKEQIIHQIMTNTLPISEPIPGVCKLEFLYGAEYLRNNRARSRKPRKYW